MWNKIKFWIKALALGAVFYSACWGMIGFWERYDEANYTNASIGNEGVVNRVVYITSYINNLECFGNGKVTIWSAVPFSIVKEDGLSASETIKENENSYYSDIKADGKYYINYLQSPRPMGATTTLSVSDDSMCRYSVIRIFFENTEWMVFLFILCLFLGCVILISIDNTNSLPKPGK